MMSQSSRGHEEVPHTADWALRVWAQDLPALFAEAALGMASLAGIRLGSTPITARTLALEGSDTESLLVAFLSELLFLQEHENVAFDHFQIAMDATRLSAEMSGAPVSSMDKQIKAVTFHNLRIERTARGFEVELVFDV